MTRRVPLALAVAFVALGAPAVWAQDKEKAAKAKTAAVENLKKIGIMKPTVVETANFIVAGSLPEAKAKALAAALEKMLPVARKAARYDDKETAWKGKLVVYFLPDSDEFKSYMRRVLQVSPEGAHADLRAEPAFIVDPAELPGKPTDADLYAATATRIAGDLLRAKGTGTQVVPEWLRDGFGRVVMLRADGTNSARYAAYKRAAKGAVIYPKGGKPPALADVWSGEKSATNDVLAMSVAEFLAFGPKAADFGTFLAALRPGEGNQTPTVMNGFEALGWKEPAAAEAAWKKWVQTGR